MLESGALAEFHFLRPWWLVAALPALGLWLLLLRRGSAERQWRQVMAPHLLAHLKVGAGDRWHFRPLHLIVAVVLLGSVALAGPTWDREIPPFTEDTAPLVIALDVSTSMNAIDVQPSRLERAKQKVSDLLAQRAGARTALIAYAGSAHMVLPLCDDASVFEQFLAALESEVMPILGKNPVKALTLAESVLADEQTSGSILFLTDGIAAENATVFADHAQRSDDEVLVLAVGTSQGGPIRRGDRGFETEANGRRAVAVLDVEGLQSLEREGGVFVAGSTVDDADVRRIQRRIQSHLSEVQQQDETARWRDQGYWLTLPVALLGLLWFRKGWTVRWGSAMLVLAIVTGCSPGGADGPPFIEFFLTPDQQGRLTFERGEYGEAAERFADPMWRGVAHFRAGDLEQAVDSFAQVATSEAAFNLGNAYAGLGRYENAVASYDAAIAERPDWKEATENREAVTAFIENELELPEEEQAGGEPSLPPDEIQFDEQGEQGQVGEVEASQLTDEQLAEMWLRRLQSSPADFLRQRFAVEAAAAEGETGQ